MFHPESYLPALTALLQDAYHHRLAYVGLQGSYLRGEATESSDIDIMVVVDGITPEDLKRYRQAIASLEGYDLSCGFICGKEDLQNWNPLEICHLLHTTKDYFGRLESLVPPYTRQDVRSFVKLSIGNLYHEICHRYVHASTEHNIAALPGSYKGVFFILQNLHYLETGHFIGTKKELLASLTGQDRLVLEQSAIFARGEAYDFDEAFALLHSWCQNKLLHT